MIKAFNKKVICQVYQVGDLVIKHIILPQSDPRGKWTPTYEGPFVIKNIVVPQNLPSHFIKIFLTRLFGLQTELGFALLKTSPCTADMKLGFEFAQGFLDFQCHI